MSKIDYKWWFELILSAGLVVLIFVITDNVNILMLGIAIPLIWLLFFVVFKESTGVFLGIMLIVGALYFLINNGLFVDILRTRKLVSVAGLWLGGGGIVGKKRLQIWEENMRNKDSSAENISVKIADNIKKIVLLLFKMTGGLVGLLIVLIVGLFISVMDGNPRVNMMFLIVPLVIVFVLLGYAIFHPVLDYIVLVPVYILLLPYKISSRLDNEAVVERSLVLSGLILGTLGLIFDV